MLPSRSTRHPVVGPRQVLGREPEVDGVLGHALERPLGRELRLAGSLAAEHRRLRLADHLDVPERVLEVVGAEVEVVHAERLLVDGRVLLAREREDGGRVVEHVVAADLIRAVRETVRVLVARGEEQDLAEFAAPRRQDDDVGRVALFRPVALDDDLGHGGAGVVGVEPDHLPVREQRDVGVLERRPHAEHVGVGLGVHEAGEAVALDAANARAERRVGLVEQDPARRVERVVAGRLEVVGELLDAGLVRDGGNGYCALAGGSVGSSPRSPCTS